MAAAAANFGDEEFEFDEADAGGGALELESVADDQQVRPDLSRGPAAGSQVAGGPAFAESADSGPSGMDVDPGPAVPSRQKDVSGFDVKKVAGFGEPQEGLLGTVKYGLRVRSRLGPLREETAQAQVAKDEAWENLDIAKAQLGRQAHRAGLDDDGLARLMRKALEADGKLQDIHRQNAKLEEEFAAKVAKVDAAVAGVEAELEPFKLQEIKAQAQYDHASTDRKRISAKIKRSEIELRNLKELIAKRQTEYSDLEKPEQERSRLLKEIAEFDKQQAPVVSRLKGEQAELEQQRAPYEAARDALAQVREKVANKNEIIAGFRRQKDELQQEHDVAHDGVLSKARGESEHAQKAWAAVGERVYVNKMFKNDTLKAVAREVQGKSEAFFAAQSLHETHERALKSYDYDTYDKAKKIMMAGGIGLLVLIVIIMAAIIT